LEGRKTMTRRIVKLPVVSEKFEDEFRGENIEPVIYSDLGGCYSLVDNLHKNPYGLVGDKLWVREKFNINTVPTGYPYHYYADNDVFTDKDSERWKPSIHMPKAAARIWLMITDVRVLFPSSG